MRVQIRVVFHYLNKSEVDVKKFLFLLIILCIMVSAYAENVYAAKIKLKTGMVVDCQIIEKTDEYVKVDFRGIDVKFALDKIDSIDEDPAVLEDDLVEPGVDFVVQEKSKFQKFSAFFQQSIERERQKTQSNRTCSLDPVSSNEVIFKTTFALFFFIFMIVSLWIINKKAGYPGWAVLVPIYNVYVSVKIAGKPGWWVLLFFVPIVSFFVWIAVSIGIAKNFGKSVGFGFGLMFLSIIFYPILAFGKSTYDPVMHVGDINLS